MGKQTLKAIYLMCRGVLSKSYPQLGVMGDQM